jgi:hypothetical protein
MVVNGLSSYIRAVLRVATACGAARLHQRACPSLLPPTPLARLSCEREVVEVKRSKSDGVFRCLKRSHMPSLLFPPFPIGKIL